VRENDSIKFKVKSLFQIFFNSVINCTFVTEAALFINAVDEGGRCDDSGQSGAFSSPLFVTSHHIVSEYVVNAMNSVRLVELEHVLSLLELQI
jgi:hypothetical protein